MADNIIIEHELESGGLAGVMASAVPPFSSAFSSRKSRRIDSNLHVDGQVNGIYIYSVDLSCNIAHN